MAAPPDIFLVWGGGGHGKVVADLIRAVGGAVVGFVDRDPAKLGLEVEPGGGRVVLTEEEFIRSACRDRRLLGGATALAMAVGNNDLRRRCRQQVEFLNLPPLVHPSAVVSPSATLGRGTVVFPRAVVNAAAIVGAGVIINTGAIVEHDVAVGDDAHVSPGAILCGAARVGVAGWIGAGAVVLPCVAVGERSVVGAGSVVCRAVGDCVTVTGVPARPR